MIRNPGTNTAMTVPFAHAAHRHAGECRHGRLSSPARTNILDGGLPYATTQYRRRWGINGAGWHNSREYRP